MLTKDPVYFYLPRHKDTLEDITLEELLLILRSPAPLAECDIGKFNYECPKGGCSLCVVRPKIRTLMLKSIKKSAIESLRDA
jgi:hypothetical protein